MPEEITLELKIPPELGNADDIIAKVKAGVRAVEDAMREHRARTGKRVLGRQRILAQSWTSTPTSIAPRRNLRPRFAGQKSARIEALCSFKEFLHDYRLARTKWITGQSATFPPGTYWLARFASIVVRPPAAAFAG